MGMGDTPTAANLLRVMRKIAKSVVDKERPDIRIGRVYSINSDTQIAQVLFPGNTVDNLVPVSFGLDNIPTTLMETTFATDGYDAAGDVVRVAGKPSAWFILDFVQGVPASVFVTESAMSSFFQDSKTTTGTGTQTLTLSNLPISGSEHVYWNGNFQAESQWSRSGKVITIPDASSLIEVGDFLECKYAYLPSDQTPDPPPVDVEITALNVRGTNTLVSGWSSIPLPAGTVLGDLLVLSVDGGVSSNPVVNDSRFVSIGSSILVAADQYAQVFVGFATDLSDIASSASGPWSAAAVVAYVGSAVLGPAANIAATGGSIVLPSIASTFAVMGYGGSSSVVAMGGAYTPTGWRKDAQALTNFSQAQIFSYSGPAPTQSSTHNGQGNQNNLYAMIGVS
jgi:hypothetical protein